jgi:hypothetical protein
MDAEFKRWLQENQEAKQSSILDEDVSDSSLLED